MDILEAFDLLKRERAVISLVGGGGKTSIMYRLAGELKQLHRKVLVTTTTAIYYPGQSLCDDVFLWEDADEPPGGLHNPVQGSVTAVGNRITEENKLKGIPVDWVDKLYKCGSFDVILVEADGSKGRPIKAPDTHEPVIPSCTSILTGVVGFDCYAERIEPLWVHRPHIFTGVVGKIAGDAIDDEVIVKLALSQNGLFKNCPEEAEKVLFINKVEEDEQIAAAERIGSSVLKQGSDIRKVLIGSILGKNPVRTVMERAVG